MRYGKRYGKRARGIDGRPIETSDLIPDLIESREQATHEQPADEGRKQDESPINPVRVKTNAHDQLWKK